MVDRVVFDVELADTQALRETLGADERGEPGMQPRQRLVGDGQEFAIAPEVLGAAISRVVGDPVLAKSMGESGRRYTTAHYGWDRVALKVEQLYENLHVGPASSKT